jgi:hypothetical protein
VDTLTFTDLVARAVRDYVAHALSGLTERMAAVESRPAPPAGPPGPPGADGTDGRDGRDSVHLDILDGVDGTRRYGRGTVAVHRGGLIRAFRATEPLDEADGLERAGWHVLVDGIADVALTLEGRRDYVQTTTLTSGKAASVRLRLSMPDDCGVYARGATYVRGDGVTWGGHYWIAQRETTDPPVEGGDAWRMAVRRGRDGKGLKGEPGGPGPKGKDAEVRWMRT